MKKGMLIVTIVLAIGVVALAVLWFLTNSAKKKTELALATTNSTYASFVEGQAKSIADLTGKLAERDGDLKKARTELQKVKDDKDAELAQKTKELNDMIAEGNAALDKAKKDIAAAQEALTAEQTAHKATKDTLAQRDETIKSKDEEISQLAATVKDWQAKEKAATDLAERYKTRLLENKIAIEPEKKFHGNVLVVNREQDFLILDLGADDAVPVGTKLEVIRDNHLIGKITVQKLVQDNNQLSVATVDCLTDPANTVREGDTVKN
jgi:flagellar basal body-associated protein FliL